MDPVSVPTPVGDAGIATLSQNRFTARTAEALARNNPFYLLSAVSMLGACLLLANSLSWSPIPFPRLLTLLGILNLYELLLLGLGLFLVRTRRSRRDSSQLLFLASLFLSDAAFLNSELVTFNLAVGITVNAVLFVLAIAKVLVVARVLAIPLDRGRLLSIALLFALLFGLPATLKACDRDSISHIHLYLCWWAAAVVFSLYDLFTGKAAGATGLDSAGAHRPWALLTTLFVTLPFLSLLSHIAILHYVYNLPFLAADAAPLLLALTVLIGRLPSPVARAIGVSSTRALRALEVVLPLVALLLASTAPRKLGIQLPATFFGGELLTPLAMTFAGVVVVWAQTLFRPHAVWIVTAGIVIGLSYLFSPRAATWSRWAAELQNLLASLIPRSQGAWGVIALVSAFLLLALGARISLRRPEDKPASPFSLDADSRETPS